MEAVMKNTLETIRFIDALFSPGDLILVRPLETWFGADGRKNTKLDYEGVSYLLHGVRNESGKWISSQDIMAGRVSQLLNRHLSLKTNFS